MLTITSSTKSAHFSKITLLHHQKLSAITINNERAYPKRTMHHKAIALCHLLRPFKVKPNDIVQVLSKDNFHVCIPAKLLLQCDKRHAIAMLAIEPESKWPIINNHTNTTAGPFEIVWLNTDKSVISNEYWAWSVLKLNIIRHNDLKPILTLKTDNRAVKRGYNVYISHCEGCHSINHKGQSTMGPDLNCPKSPLAYYPDIKTLKKFIRDPKSVRVLPYGRMSGSDTVTLPEKSLDDLIAFFKYIEKDKHECL